MSPIQSHNLYLASTATTGMPVGAGIAIGCVVGAIIVFVMWKRSR